MTLCPTFKRCLVSSTFYFTSDSRNEIPSKSLPRLPNTINENLIFRKRMRPSRNRLFFFLFPFIPSFSPFLPLPLPQYLKIIYKLYTVVLILEVDVDGRTQPFIYFYGINNRSFYSADH